MIEVIYEIVDPIDSRLLPESRYPDLGVKRSSKVEPKSVYVIPPLMKHLAGQHDQKTHGSWATGIAEKISLKTAGLKDKGATQEFLKSEKQKDEIYENLEEIAARVASESEDIDIDDILFTDGFQMTSKALEFDRSPYFKGMSYTSVLRTENGDVAGAAAVARTSFEETTPESADNTTITITRAESIVEIFYLGTSGIVDGAGSMLYGQAINYAYQNNMGLQLYPLAQAVSFWKNMGFKETSSEYLRMSFEEVEAIWKELTIVESAMPNV
jgi:hypothetical protein